MTDYAYEKDPFLFQGDLPPWTVATSVDEDGDIFAYSDKPVRTRFGWTANNLDDKAQFLGSIPPRDDWKDSLRLRFEYEEAKR